jgi:hypothetical protein
LKGEKVTSQSFIIHGLTHRDYGPFRDYLSMNFFPAQASRRLNLSYPRGNITQSTFGP